MALIKCYECGKEISDKAPACIHCGFPLANISDGNTKAVNKEVVYCQLLDGISESIFNNGLDDGAEGICKEKNFNYEYSVVGDTLFVKRNAGTVEYKIDGDFLVNKNGRHIGMIPDSDTFNITLRFKNFMGGIDVVSYKTDGSYSGTTLGRSDVGTYKRQGSIIVQCGNSTGNLPNGFLIYQNNLYIACSIKKKDRISILESLFAKFNSQRPIHTINIGGTIQNSSLNKPIVKCPYCQSMNTSKISASDKLLNVAIFGVFGNKRKCQWHCNNCKSDF